VPPNSSPDFFLHRFPAAASNQADAGQSRTEDRQTCGLRYLRCSTAGARAGVAASIYRSGATDINNAERIVGSTNSDTTHPSDINNAARSCPW